MRALSASELLSVWEIGSRQVPLQRALTMLAVACPEISSESLAGLTIGRRDARLLALREMTFGCEITGVTDCPECGETIELSFNSSDLRLLNETQPPNELAVKSNGSEVRFRLPTGADLLKRPYQPVARISGKFSHSNNLRRTVSDNQGSEGEPLFLSVIDHRLCGLT